MSIYKGNDHCIVFRGDYKPAELYRGDTKIAGWTETTDSGSEIVLDGTYNDVLNLTVNGKHDQRSGYAIKYTQERQKYSCGVGGDFTGYELQGDGVYSVSGRGSGYYNQDFRISGTFKENHIYWLYAQCMTTRERAVIAPNMYAPTSGSLSTLSTSSSKTAVADTWYDMGVIAKITKANLVYFRVQFGVSNQMTLTQEDKCYVRNWCLIDLTETFGEGFEPTKVSECLSLIDMSLEKIRWGRNNGTFEFLSDTRETAYPTPSPEFPQEIVPTVPSAVVSGKNLFSGFNTSHRSGNIKYVGNKVHYKGGTDIDTFWRLYVSKPLSAGTKISVSFKVRGATNPRGIMTFARNSYTGSKLKSISFVGDRKYSFTAIIPEGANLTQLDQDDASHFYSDTDVDLYDWQIEISDTPTSYAPYRADQQLINDFQLYGSDGVYDTLEPCVKVDGEWRCRVTRRWGKWVYDGVNTVHCDTNYVYYPESRPYNYVYLSNRPFVINQYTKHCLSNRGVFANSLSSGFSNGGVVTTTVASVFVPNQAVRDNSKEEYLAAVQEYLRQHPYEVIVERETPIVELYDPIMLYTNPYTTIIRGNTEMVATAKVADLPDKSS